MIISSFAESMSYVNRSGTLSTYPSYAGSSSNDGINEVILAFMMFWSYNSVGILSGRTLNVLRGHVIEDNCLSWTNVLSDDMAIKLAW